MITLFNMKPNPVGRINNAALKTIHQAEVAESQRDSKSVLRYLHLVLIALFLLFFSFNAPADTLQDEPVLIQAAAEVADSNDQEKARQRELVAEAILHEKLKMKTDVRDLNNQKRAEGEILRFDVFLGAFLTALWAMISLFIATQFLGSKDGTKSNGKSGVTLFYVSASFVPLILLWVAISTGYTSWWLTLAISVLIYWLMGFVFKKMKISATGSI